MSQRYEYSLKLSDFDDHGHLAEHVALQLKSVEAGDVRELAELMIEAYRGTIDDDGETLDDAIAEVQTYLSGRRGVRPDLIASRMAYVGSQLVGACLVGKWDSKQLPLIAYVMTRSDWKNRGVARQVLGAVLKALRELGHQEVRAVITEGNTASERLLGRAGFQRIGTM